MESTIEFRRAFVKRLKQACDESPYIPEPGHGRQQYIVDRLGVTPEAVSKWFNAIAMPRPEKMEKLSELLECDQAWLAFGIAPEMERAERRMHARESDGAVQLVLGMIMLDDGHCGQPQPSDPRSAYVDFYATIRGSVYPIHVSLARETAKDTFEAIIPKEYRDVRNVAVIPSGPLKYQFLDMPLSMIEGHKVRKQGAFSVPICKGGTGKFVTGHDVWPRIRRFASMGTPPK